MTQCPVNYFQRTCVFFFQYLYIRIIIKTEGQRTYAPNVESCFSFSQIGQAFFLFWYVVLDLAVIKAVLLFLSDFQHIFKGCIVPLKEEIFL